MGVIFMNKLRKALLAASAACAAFAVTTPASAINIVLRPDSSFSSAPNGAAALYAFQKAANYWNHALGGGGQTINVSISFASLAPNIIGQAGSARYDVSAQAIYQALASHSATALDAVAVQHLVPLTANGGVGYRRAPAATGNPLTGTGLNTTPGSVFDNDDSYNNTVLYANGANLKVLGFNVGSSAIDAAITFNQNFAFDYDPTDGISVGTQDFTSVAAHELGHALGFVSGTDYYDVYGAPNGPGASIPVAWNNESVLSVLDLFRRSTNGGAAGFDPATGERYIQLDPNRGAGFSINGTTFYSGDGSFSQFSTGRYNGDGNQASHWKDGTGYFDANNCFVPDPQQIGIMDPTSGSCQMGIVTSNDLAAFDAIGYNPNVDLLSQDGRNYEFTTAQMFGLGGLAAVPEPAVWAQLILGFGVIGGGLRRVTRRKRAAAIA